MMMVVVVMVVVAVVVVGVVVAGVAAADVKVVGPIGVLVAHRHHPRRPARIIFLFQPLAINSPRRRIM